VQGVGFRWSTRERARELALAGWVVNLPDGSVEVLAEGPQERVESLITWLREGPPGARVVAADVQRAEPTGRAAFEVRVTPYGL
jgi:acylphosphatase